MGSKPKNIYARGADDGAWMGLYLVAIFGCLAASSVAPIASVPAVVLMLGVPFLTYYFLRRTHRAAYGLTQFSALWMQGIVMFACGALIFGVCSYVYLRWLDEGFIRRVMEQAVVYYGSLPDPTGEYEDMSTSMTKMLEHNTLPSSSTMTAAWMWLIVFSGSVLSAIVAAVARLRRVPDGLR